MNDPLGSWDNFFDQASDPIQGISATGQFLYTNPAWRSHVGYNRADLERLVIWDLLKADSRDRLLSALAAESTCPNPVPLALSIIAKDGRQIGLRGTIHRRNCALHGAVFWSIWYSDPEPIESSSLPFDAIAQLPCTRQPALQHLLLQTEAALQIRDQQVHQMVENLQRHESELKDKEEFLGSVFNGLEEAIFVVDVSDTDEFRYVAINPTCERLMGCLSTALHGKTPSSIFAPDVAVALLARYQHCATTQTHITYEECVSLQGQATWWMTSLTPLCNVQGTVNRIVGTSVEITDRKQAEMLLQMQTERERLIFSSVQRIHQSLDLQETLQTTVDEVRRFLQNDRVVIYRFKPDWSGDIATESVQHPRWSILGEMIDDQCFQEKYAQAYRHGRVQVLDDIYDAQLTPCYLEQLERLQVRANLVVPIIRGDVLWGLLIAHECTLPRAWQQIDVDLLQQLAEKVAIAVNQAELYKKAQTEIEERKRTEEALVESQTRFHNLVANVPGMIFRFVLQPDQSIRFAFLSSGCHELLGLEPEAVEQNSHLLFDLVHPDDCPALVASMQYSAQQSDPWRWEGRFVVPSQPLKWLRGVARPSCQGNGDLVWDGVMTDITREKQAEEWLRLMESAITNANDAIVITESRPLDLLGPRIVYVNPAFTRNTGYRPHEVIGKTPRILQGAKTDKQQLDHIREALQNWQPIRAELINYRKDQTEFWSDINIMPITDETGMCSHWMAIQRDITNRKHAEAEIIRALGRERELNELRSQFISVTSHEFRTPLTTIQSSADLLRYFDCDEQERDELFGQIQNSISHMIRLLEDVLFIGHAESGKLEFSPGSFHLPHFCQTLVAEVETATQSRCPIEFHYQGDRLLVLMDKKLLRQILTNLLSNAVKYSPPDHPVIFTVDAQSDSMIFQVKDTGIGISPADQQKLFECFHRGRNVGTTPGTGLGLFIVNQCVELHHGHISVESAVNQGSNFIVTLPASPTQGDSICENHPRH